MNILPKEVFLNVLGFLGPADLLTCALVSHYWRECCHDDFLWKVFADRLSAPCFEKFIEQGKGHFWNAIARLFVRRILVEGFSVLNDEQDGYALLRQFLCVVTMGKPQFSWVWHATPPIRVDRLWISQVSKVVTIFHFEEDGHTAVWSDEKIILSLNDSPYIRLDFDWRPALKDAFVSGFLF